MGKENSILILGSGTSTGTPIPACSCPTCSSNNPRNRRFRTSLLLQTASGNNILFDSTPDLRSQVLINQVNKIDGVVITHDHADHIHGIDDLRPFCFGPPLHSIPLWTSSHNAQTIVQRFPYIFPQWLDKPLPPQVGGGIPLIDLHKVELINNELVESNICQERFYHLPLPHGPYGESMASIHRSFAYLTDISDIPDIFVNKLKSLELDLLIIDCVRERFHPTHLNVKTAIQYILRIAPKRAGLIHMNHDLDHDQLEKEVKKVKEVEIFPTYDGQILTYN
jgi:phosphoribosyl 1,2-cyclic phosphate phosphodiesterase